MWAAARAEEAILGLLLLKNDVAERVFREKSLSEEDFVTDFHKKVFLMLKEAWEAGEPPELSTLSDRLSADEIGRLMHLKLQRAELEKNDYGVFLECVNRLRKAPERRIPQRTSGQFWKRKEAGRTEAPERERKYTL